ncbi:MAG: DNA repair protein RecN [Lentimicrobiaceae bacterium]|nr:DNA repair protein RecN [Lentimicrobiaceae bacterium]
MLQHLSVSNYALINSLSIDFDNGFTIITGETGAGKSILLGALGFVLGNRADSNILLDDTKKCVVEAVFSLNENDDSQYEISRLKFFFDENDIDYENECIIRRELTPQKKSRSFINDTPVSIQTLKELGNQLVDIHSQHDSLLLCNPEFQLELLDEAAHNKILLSDYKNTFSQYSKAKHELNELRIKAHDNIGENDYLKFQYDELDKAQLLDNEYDELVQKIEILENQEEIKSLLGDSIELLDNNDFSLLNQTNSLIGNIDKLRKFYQNLDTLSERINSIKIEFKDIYSDLTDLYDDSQYDSSSLEFLQQRYDSIQHLMMKHHLNDYSLLLKLRDDIKHKLAEFSNIDEIVSEKEKEVKALENELFRMADELNKRRQEAKIHFEKDVTAVIRQLAMPHGVFEIRCDKTKDLTSNGTDAVMFMFSANKGFSPDNMAKAASGGELSRLMLAIKSVAANNNYIPTLIFDEIDTGVSGEVASKLGDIMRSMGTKLQIISITHLPQVASKAKQHFFVYKDESNDKTFSNIRKLSQQERIVEIAKMLSNDEISSEALKTAEVLLTQ